MVSTDREEVAKFNVKFTGKITEAHLNEVAATLLEEKEKGEE